MNDRPARIYNFLEALSQASREHGVKIAGGFDIAFVERPTGRYAIDPNGPEAKVRWMDESPARDPS